MVRVYWNYILSIKSNRIILGHVLFTTGDFENFFVHVMPISLRTRERQKYG